MARFAAGFEALLAACGLLAETFFTRAEPALVALVTLVAAFLIDDFAAGFLAVAFLAAGLFAADFLAVTFLAEVLATDFLEAAGFLTAGFLFLFVATFLRADLVISNTTGP